MTGRGFISDQEINEASDALIEWLKTQDLSPVDAVPVLIKTLSAALISMCGAGKIDLARGANIVSVELMNCLEGRQ